MRNEDYLKVRKLLIYGMIGAVLTMIGDFLLLAIDSAGAAGVLGQYILAAEKISYTRIGLAGSFGFAGIPVTAFGFYALYELMQDKASVLARIYKASIYGFLAFGGAIHIICCYLVTGIKKALEAGTDQESMLSVILAEQGGYLIPCFIIFMAFYFANVITLILIIAKGKTPLPRWMWLINPFAFKILLNLVGKMSTAAFWNGIACSNMSLGALIIFLAWMVVVLRRR